MNKTENVELKKIIFILGVLFIFQINLLAQDYKVLTYTNKEGLHNNLTKSVAQDTLGFIWVATDNGLERFDGKNFYSYTNGLPSNYVKSFFRSDHAGFLAVTDMGIIKITAKADTAEFDTIAMGSIRYTDSLLFYPKLVFEDHNQDLWITDNNSLWLLKDQKLKKYDFEKKNYTINFQRSFAIAENRFGDMYVFSETGYTHLFNRKKDRFIEQKNIPRFPSVHGARFVDDSRILIASHDGVYELTISGENPRVRRVLQTDACDIEQMNDSVFFIASWTGGVHKCNIRHKQISIEKISGVHDVKVNNLFIDKKKNLWLSSDQGLVLAQNLPFNSMSQLLNRIFVQSIDISSSGKVYCIADNAYSIVKRQGELHTDMVFTLSRSGNLSQIAICKSDPSVIFIATTNAQLYVLKDGKVMRTMDLSGYGRVLFYLTCDQYNNLWACLDGCDGVLKISKGFEVEQIDKLRGLTSRGIVVRSDSEGNLYCGGIGESSYLFKYDYNSGMFNNVSTELPFPHSKDIVVNDLTINNGTVYMGTTEGVVQKDGKNIKLLNLGENSKKNVSCIANDNNGYIWFSNEKGLFKYKSGKYYIFSENDGLNTIVGSYRCLDIDTANQIWFGTQTGLNYSVGINEVEKTEKPMFTKVLVNGNPVSSRKLKQTINKHSFIRFEFISLEMPGKDIAYKTKLVGHEEDWSAETYQNDLLLHNIPTGEYTLNIKARQQGNYDWSDVAQFEIIIVPNWYQTWWAYVLYFLILVLLFVFFNALYHRRLINQKKRLEYKIKLRTDEIMSKNKQLQYLNATKDKFFNIIAHDLKNPFSSILGLTELLLLHFDEYADDKKRELVELVNASTKDTYTLLENLLSWARTQTNVIEYKPERINLAGLVKDSAEISAAAIHSKSIKMIYHVSPEIEVMADRNMLTTVVRNLIMNAIKYSYRNGSIVVEGARESDTVKVSVIDHGVGIEPDRMKELFEISEKTSEPGTENEKGTGLGLILCKEFVEKHGGIIDVKSVKGQGSTFWFKIPG